MGDKSPKDKNKNQKQKGVHDADKKKAHDAKQASTTPSDLPRK